MGFNVNTKIPNLNFDTPEYEDKTPTPEGVYNVKCVGFRTDEKDGMVRLGIRLQLVEGVYKGKLLYCYLRPWTYERDFLLLRSMLQNMGFSPDEVKEIGKSCNDLLHAMEGLHVKVKNKITVKEDRVFNNVQMFFPVDNKYFNGSNLLSEYKARKQNIEKVLDKGIHREWK